LFSHFIFLIENFRPGTLPRHFRWQIKLITFIAQLNIPFANAEQRFGVKRVGLIKMQSVLIQNKFKSDFACTFTFYAQEALPFLLLLPSMRYR
jgi:hypothetical protein